MKKADLDCLTERHLLLFGTVIQWFARYEWLMQEVMATVAESDAGSIMLLTRGLDFSGTTGFVRSFVTGGLSLTGMTVSTATSWCLTL